MRNIPLVSVVIPAYNASQYLAEAIDSVLSQTHSNLEIIVVNDGSTDNTLDILESYQPKLKVLTQAQAGVAEARNTGIKAATGEYLAFVDSDDYWFKDKIGLQLAYLQQHPDVGAVYNDWKVWEPINDSYPDPGTLAPSAVGLDIDPNQSGWLYGQLLLDCIIHTSTLMIRKPILDQAGYFDGNLRIGEDYDLWLRLSRLAKIDKLAAPLSLYRTNPESITNKKPLNTNYRYLVLKRALEKWGYANPDGSSLTEKQVNQQLSSVCFAFAYQHYQTGDLGIALDAIMASLKYQPLYIPAIKTLIKILGRYCIGFTQR